MRRTVMGVPAVALTAAMGIVAAMYVSQPADAGDQPWVDHSRQITAAIVPVTTTIQAAIDAAQPGDQVVIPAGTFTESLTLSKTVSLLGQGAGQTIVRALAGSRVLTVTGSGIGPTVVISGFEVSGGNIAAFGGPAGQGGGIVLRNGASPAILNLRLFDNRAEFGGGIYAESGVTLAVAGTAIISNSANVLGGGIYALSGTSLSVSRVLSNVAGSDGGGAWVTGPSQLILTDLETNRSLGGRGGGLAGFGPVSANGGVVFANQASLNGGGIYADDVLTLSGLQIIGNQAVDGGGFYGKMTGTVNGGQIRQNRASGTGGGGGGYLGAASTVSGTTIISNTSAKVGGGFSFVGPILIENATFQGNESQQAAGGGGGLYGIGPFVLNNTDFLNNRSVEVGGAIVAPLPLTITGGMFRGNSSLNQSGGAMFVGTSAVITGAQFISNTAFLEGGAIVANGPLTISNSRLDGNQGLTAGGGAIRGSAPIWVSGTDLSGNQAFGSGGAILASAGGFISGGSVRFNQSSSGDGGAIAFNSLGVVTATQFFSNVASSNGGTIAATNFGQPLHLSGVRIEQGSAAGQGGGVFALGETVITGSSFISNAAVSFGGGLRSNGPTMIVASRFEGGRGSRGGAVHVGRQLQMTGTILLRNTATGEGGALFHEGIDPARIVNSLFAENSALGESAALRLNAVAAAPTVQLLHVTIADRGLNPKAAISVVDGSVLVRNSIVARHTVGLERIGGSVEEGNNLFAFNTDHRLGTITLLGGGSDDGDPAFLDPLAGNYHLRRASAARDLVDTVGIDIDVDNESRPVGVRFDAGFDEQVNHPPTARLTISPTVTTTGFAVLVDGSASSDPDADPLTLTFAFGSETVVGPQSGLTATHAFNVAASQRITLTVSDGIATSIVTGTVTVNALPTPSPTPIPMGKVVHLPVNTQIFLGRGW